MLVLLLFNGTEVTSPGQRPGQQFMEILSCLDIKIPPLGRTGVIQSYAVHYILHKFGCRSCRYGNSNCTIPPFGAPLQIFFLGSLP